MANLHKTNDWEKSINMSVDDKDISSAQARRKKIPKTNKNFLEGNSSGGLPP